MSQNDPNTAALTGGIASGKSTVARMFEELGAYLIDADIVARQVVEPGELAWQEILEHFGTTILLDNARINRKKLGAIIFHQPAERQKLNRIIHPRVIEQIAGQIENLRPQQPERLILVDVPLLIEANMHHDYATILVVYVPKQVQLTRLTARDHITEQEALTKIHSQMPLDEKLQYATHILRNDESLEKMQAQVRKISREISGRKMPE